MMTTNPYPQKPGFRQRVTRAEMEIKKLAENPGHTFDRSFDTCFEMFDGDAVVFALMDKAKTEVASGRRSLLAEGIKKIFPPDKLNDAGWPEGWDKVHTEGASQQGDLFR